MKFAQLSYNYRPLHFSEHFLVHVGLKVELDSWFTTLESSKTCILDLLFGHLGAAQEATLENDVSKQLSIYTTAYTE